MRYPLELWVSLCVCPAIQVELYVFAVELYVFSLTGKSNQLLGRSSKNAKIILAFRNIVAKPWKGERRVRLTNSWAPNAQS